MIKILVILVVIGVLLYFANTMIPIYNKIKTIINAVVILGVIIWLLNVFGLLSSGNLRLN